MDIYSETLTYEIYTVKTQGHQCDGTKLCDNGFIYCYIYVKFVTVL